MRLWNITSISEPNLLRFTEGERNLDWLWKAIRIWWLSWIGSCILIWIRFLQPNLDPSDVLSAIISVVGLPLSAVAIAAFLMIIVITGMRLASMGIQNEQSNILLPAEVSITVLFWGYVLGTLHRIRYWTWIIGISPYLLWIGCQSYVIFWALPSDLRGYTTLLGHHYFYSDGSIDLMRLLEILWFMSLTIGLVGLAFLAILCVVGITMKIRGAKWFVAAGVLGFILPFVFGIVLLAAPEGFLSADTARTYAAINASFMQVLSVSIIIALLPLAVSLGVQRLMRLWMLK